MSTRFMLIIGCSLGITLASGTVAHAQCSTEFLFSWTLDNDTKAWVTWPWGGNSYPSSDDGYTSGSKWTVGRHRPDTKPVWPFRSATNRCFQRLWAGGWEMYTPAEHSLQFPDLNSRPYAGLLEGSYIAGALDYGFNGNSNSLKKTQTVEIALGLVGPATRMKELQWWIHQRGNVPSRPTWAFQINNEFGGGGFVSYRLSRKMKEWSPFGKAVDFSLSGGGSLGNFLTDAVGVATLRFELLGDISDDVLPSDKLFSRPPPPPPPGGNWFLTALNYVTPRDSYLFFETKPRLVLYDITLDGNLWADKENTHTVKKEPWVTEFVGAPLPGLVFRWRIWKLAPRLTFNFVRRSPPFGAQTLTGHCCDEHLTVNPTIAGLANQWEYFGSWEFSLF